MSEPRHNGLNTVFIDMGEPGHWLAMIANSPCLNVSDYPGTFPPETIGTGVRTVSGLGCGSVHGEGCNDV